MPDDYAEHLHQHDEILRSLAAMLVKMDGYLARQEAINADLTAFNARQLAINEDVKTTLARVETLLARLLRPSDNGLDA